MSPLKVTTMPFAAASVSVPVASPRLLLEAEVVVPAAMVQAGAVDFLKGSIPGFAAGSSNFCAMPTGLSIST